MKLRFDSKQGALKVEDLWDLPLTTQRPNTACLDDIAISLDKELKESNNVSFVRPTSERDVTTRLKFEIVKHIIEVLMAENEAKAARAANKEKKQQIMELIQQKQNQELASKSVEELRAMVESL